MLELYAIKEYETKSGEKKSVWIRIGSAFTNKDGSTNLLFDVFPVSKDVKTIQMREAKPKEQRTSESKIGRFTDDELKPDEDISF